jgi:hypothetical protein
MKKIIIAGFLIIAIAGLTSCEGSYVVTERPADPVYVQTVSPGADYVWVGGDWAWEGGRYNWHNGYWDHPHGNKHWQGGSWETKGNGYRWHRGGWH